MVNQASAPPGSANQNPNIAPASQVGSMMSGIPFSGARTPMPPIQALPPAQAIPQHMSALPFGLQGASPPPAGLRPATPNIPMASMAGGIQNPQLSPLASSLAGRMQAPGAPAVPAVQPQPLPTPQARPATPTPIRQNIQPVRGRFR
jgi:hypothetical protein